MNSLRRISCLQVALTVILSVSPVVGGDPIPIEITAPVEFKSAPINYFEADSADIVKMLDSKVQNGEVTLSRRDSSGYLLDLLRALDIPVSSQTLVFSRTSLQEQLISPKNPRAIYFNDEVAVGWIPGSSIIELAAQDPLKGTMFYTLSQSEDTFGNGKAAFHREERCTECHLSNATMSVPGLLVRSIQVDEDGERDAQGPYADVTHAIPYSRRWGGWYVTGRSEKMVHGGNFFGAEDADRHEQDPTFRGTLTDLSPLVDLSGYPTKQSDIVALLVLDHQLHFYNLVTRVHYEHRLGVRSDAEEQLARYAMMEDEAPLPGPVTGSTDYVKWYQSGGFRDAKGRTLRDLNLKTMLYEHRLSPLVFSRPFQSLPLEVKTRLWNRFRASRGTALEIGALPVAPQRTSESKPVDGGRKF